MTSRFTRCNGIALTAIALIFAFTSPARAEDKSPWSAEAGMGFYSDYISRGTNLYDGVSLQPSLSGAYDLGDYGSLGGSLWMHLSGEGEEGASEKFTELDSTLNYTLDLDPITLKAGHIWYSYPNDSDELVDTAEFFAGIAVDTVLSPSLTVYWDYREVDFQYYELGFSHKIKSECESSDLNLTPFVNFGFASDSEKIYADDGFVQATFGVYSELPLGEQATLVPIISYTSESDDNADNEFWFGFNLKYAF